MIHEVIVTPQRADAFTRERVDEHLRAEWRCVTSDGDGWQYVNPDTAVRFSLAWVDDPSPSVACRLACPRPRFFADESMALIRSLCEALELRVEANDAWERSQAQAVEALREVGMPVLRWSASDAESWWRYERQRRSLLERLDEVGVFAPRAFLFADKRSEPRVRTAIAWCDAQATLFPPADLIMILDRSLEPTESGQDTRLRGFVERSQVLAALEGHLGSFSTDAGELPVLDAKPSIRRLFRELRVGEVPSSDSFEGISADRAIDTGP